MAIVTALLKNTRKSPSKILYVARAIKGKTVDEALSQLTFIGKESAQLLMKLIKTGMANAEHNFGLVAKDLKIQKIEVLKGAMYKRWRPRSRGMTHPLLKKTAHIKLYLDDGRVEVNQKIKTAEIKKQSVPAMKVKEKSTKIDKKDQKIIKSTKISKRSK